MAHELEIVDGVAQMAYAGETPWHNLGVRIPNDLTPVQMMNAAGLNWEVEMRPSFATVNGKQEQISTGVLVRLPNEKNIKKESILTEVRREKHWKPLQNKIAFEFFNECIAEGDMSMECAGSLFDGKRVWALAKVKEHFTVLGKKDRIDSYLLFSNPHMYGFGIDIRFTPIRVVCNNTLTWSLDSKAKNKVSVGHGREFDPRIVKEKLGLAHNHMEQYKEQAQFLASKKASSEDVVTYLKRIFKVGDRDPNKPDPKRAQKDTTKAAATAHALLTTQPGAEIAPGSWWNAFNAATFYVDHIHGKNDNTRVNNAWFGPGVNKKQEALTVALEMATAS